jgi:hypothetical protein
VRCRSAFTSMFRSHSNSPSVTSGMRISVTFQMMPLPDGARCIVADVVFMISLEPKLPVTVEDK